MEVAWIQLFMLPKACLGPPPRGGKQHQDQAIAYTMHRLERWQAGECVDLWRSLRERRARPNQSPDDELAARHRRCLSLLQEGRYADACKALISTGTVRRTPATEAALRAKHPSADPPDLSDLGPPSPAAVPDIDVDARLAARDAAPSREFP